MHRRATVLTYYAGIGTSLALLGWLDLHDPERRWLGWVSIAAAAAVVAAAAPHSARYRAALTTAVAFAMIFRLGPFLLDRDLTIGAILLAIIWVTLLVGFVAMVTADADIPVAAKTEGEWTPTP